MVEVKGTAPGASTGVLAVQANGRWRLSGFEGDPIHVRDNDSSPFDQVTSNVFNLKELVRKHHPDAFVDGMIVVVPPRESTITLNVESRRRGCTVVLGANQNELRGWFHRTASRRLIWTAERVHALLGDMNLADQVTVEELVADGFPLEDSLRAGMVSVMLEATAREARSVDGSRSAEILHAGDTSANSDVTLSHSTVVQPHLAPIVPQLSAFSSTQPSEIDIVGEDDRAVSASDGPMPPLVATHMRARSDASELDASESDVLEPAPSEAVASGTAVHSGPECRQLGHRSPLSLTDQKPVDAVDVTKDGQSKSVPEDIQPEPKPHRTESLPAARLTQTQPVSLEPSVWESADAESFAAGSVAAKSSAPESFAAESAVPEPTASEPVLSGAAHDPAAQSASALSSPFTGRWSSWIESDEDRPLRPHPTPAPLPNRLPWWSTEDAGAQPLRRPTKASIIERRPRLADLRRVTAAPSRTTPHDRSTEAGPPSLATDRGDSAHRGRHRHHLAAGRRLLDPGRSGRRGDKNTRVQH